MENVMIESNVAISGRLEGGTCSKFNAVGEYINPPTSSFAAHVLVRKYLIKLKAISPCIT